MDIHRVFRVLIGGFRRRRMRRFLRTFRPREDTRILDVGGTALNWRLVDARARVTLLNLAPPASRAEAADFTLVAASGTRLPYRDAAFEVAFSNSVIEHLESWENQCAFAEEVRRVGRGIWVQTPARSFPADPHVLAPFVHYLPVSWQRRLLRRCTPWGWIARPTPEMVERYLRETRLLSGREMRALFPDCEIRRERFLGLTKSYVAVRTAS